MNNDPVSVFIHAPVARAFERAKQVKSGKLELMSVKDEMDAAKALGDPLNDQHCPFCHEYFSTNAFIAHAQQCIDIHAPRHKFWMPAEVKGALAVFPEKINGQEFWASRGF